jgi:hypothetical protein
LLLGGQNQDFNGPSSTEILILIGVRVRVMVFNGTFNNISVILQRNFNRHSHNSTKIQTLLLLGFRLNPLNKQFNTPTSVPLSKYKILEMRKYHDHLMFLKTSIIFGRR